MSKKLLGFVPGVILGASLFISIPSLAVGLAASPSPCDVVGTPFLTMTRSLSNNPDSGNFGNWATDAYTQNITVWVGTDGLSYCANANTTDGTFVTTGPQSPEAGAALAAGITGTFTGGENYSFPFFLDLNPAYSTTSPQTVTLPADSSVSASGKFSWWVNDVFPSVASTSGSTYVDTYYLVYNTANNGSWTNADALSGGNSGDITGSASSVYVNADGVCSSQAPCYTTIQAGIDAVASGGTVNVAAGTYDEQITIDQPVTLQGAGTGTILASTASGYGITINNANNVSILDLYVDRAGFGGGVQLIGAQVNDLEISGVTVTGASNATDHLISPYVGLRVSSGTDVDGVTMVQSHFDGNDIGWYLAKESAASGGTTSFSNVDVSLTSFDNNLMKGIYAEKLDNALFDNITALNSGTDPTYGFNAGIDINLKWSAYENITIQNATVTGSGLAGTATNMFFPAGVTIKARDDASSYNTTPASLANVTLHNVTVSGGVVGLRFGEAGKTNLGPLNVSVTNSNLSGTGGFGLVNESLSTTTATNNYWGTEGSPASMVSGPVEYSPWYSDAAQTMLAYEFATSTNGSETTATTGGTTTTLVGTSTSNGSVNVTAEIPAGTTITGSSTWDGTVEAPVATTTTVSVSGFDTTVIAAIAIGSDDSDLYFDKAVKITFEGQAGKRVGWYNHAGAFTEITATCSDNTQLTNDALAAGGSCKIDDGANLAVWTKHFSIFVAYTQTAQATSGGGSGGGGGGGGGNGAPVGTIGTTNAVIPTTDTNNTNTATPDTSTSDTDTGSNASAPIANNTSGGEVLGSQGSGSATVVGQAAETGPVEIASSTGETAATSSAASSTVSLTASVANTSASIPTWGWAAIALAVLAGIGGLLFYNRPQAK